MGLDAGCGGIKPESSSKTVRPATLRGARNMLHVEITLSAV